MKKIIILIILVLFGIIIFPLKSLALTVSPAKLELSADPGDKIIGIITLISNEGERVSYYTSFERLEVVGIWGEPKFTGEKTGLATWIEISPSKITLEPRERKEVSFSIQIPEDAQPGGHYAAIFFGTAPPEGGVGIATRMAVLVLLRVSGEVIESGEILNFRAEKKVFNYLPVNFSFNLKNTGTVHLKPEGEIVIKNIFGKTAEILPVNREGYNALPNSERVFSASWLPKSEIKGEGFLAGLKKERAGFGLGYYKAILDLKFGEKGTAQASFGFWIIPWRILVVSILILAVLLLLIVKGIKVYNRWIVTKAKAH